MNNNYFGTNKRKSGHVGCRNYMHFQRKTKPKIKEVNGTEEITNASEETTGFKYWNFL